MHPEGTACTSRAGRIVKSSAETYRAASTGRVLARFSSGSEVRLRAAAGVIRVPEDPGGEAVHPGSVLDGTLIPIDRVAADRPFYPGKHKQHGMNLQVIASLDGDLLRVSGALPGSGHFGFLTR